MAFKKKEEPAFVAPTDTTAVTVELSDAYKSHNSIVFNNIHIEITEGKATVCKSTADSLLANGIIKEFTVATAATK